MHETATSRWSLVCDRSIIRAIIQSLYFVGQFFGSAILGAMSDHVGRKPVFVFSILLQACCGIVLALVPHWGLFALFRFGVGFAHPGIFMLAVVIGTELSGPKYRLLASASVSLFWTFGIMILGSLTYLFNDYRHLQLAISAPQLLLICYWWLVPESSRWLVSRGRFDDATKILRRVAKCNGRPSLPPDWYCKLEKEPDRLSFKHGLVALFRTPNLRKRTLISFILWPVVAMGYYGLAANPSFMGGDDRLGFIVGGALEIPGIFIMVLFLNFLGRVFMTSLCYFISGLCLFLTLAVPPEAGIASLLLVLIGKGALNIVFTLVFVMAPEHYPTSIRNTAAGTFGAIARAGSIAASFLSMYLADTQPATVAIIFATLTIVAGIATLFLPETTGEPLLETIEQAEDLGKDQSFFMLGYHNRRRVEARKQ